MDINARIQTGCRNRCARSHHFGVVQGVSGRIRWRYGRCFSWRYGCCFCANESRTHAHRIRAIKHVYTHVVCGQMKHVYKHLSTHLSGPQQTSRIRVLLRVYVQTQRAYAHMYPTAYLLLTQQPLQAINKQCGQATATRRQHSAQTTCRSSYSILSCRR